MYGQGLFDLLCLSGVCVQYKTWVEETPKPALKKISLKVRYGTEVATYSSCFESCMYENETLSDDLILQIDRLLLC